MSDDTVLLVERSAGIATLTLNRPKARNALNAELRRALWNTASELRDDDSIAAIVLTGADPSFCAGLDLKELAASDGAALSASIGTPSAGSPVTAPIPTMTKPIIGAVGGPAITGGFELALACDFLVASPNAVFADTHARVGIQPGWGLTVLLPEAVGYRRARELSATGNFLDADTALAWGLVNHVVPHDDLVPFAQRLAADIVGNDTAAVARIMQTYQEGELVDRAEAWRIEATASAQWQTGRSGDDLEARRKAVTERGRAQI